jgi:hypothetical protein
MRSLIALIAVLVSQTVFAQLTSNRTALIIGISEYAVPGATLLDGVRFDMASSTKIANAMGIPDTQIKYLKNAEATKENILKALNQLAETTQDGSRAFIYFSGHGTRELIDDSCVEGLLTYEGKTITHQEFAKATQSLVKSADKVITMIDACHAEGVAPPKGQTRAISKTLFTPKYFAKSGNAANSCSVVANLKTRGLLPEITRLGGLQENFVQITSSRPDEQSLDQPGMGGLATVAIRDCLLGKAKDVNRSGAVSMSEVQQCAQNAINLALKGNPTFAPHHVTVSGNRNLIPVQRPTTTSTTLAAAPVEPIKQPSTPSSAAPTSPPSVNALTVPPVPVPPVVNPSQQAASQAASAPAPSTSPTKLPAPEQALASLATLKDIEQQRNPKRLVEVQVSKPALKIGKDSLDLSIKSSHDGYLYLILLGSDSKSFYVLYPNGLDKNNQVKAGQTVRIPRPDWEVKAAGPVGTNNLLVMVSDSPRKLNTLTMSEPTAAEPFTYALNDIGGRSALIHFLTSSGTDGKSESFGAKLVAVKEVK